MSYEEPCNEYKWIPAAGGYAVIDAVGSTVYRTRGRDSAEKIVDALNRAYADGHFEGYCERGVDESAWADELD